MTKKELYTLINGRQGKGISSNEVECEGIVDTTSSYVVSIGNMFIGKENITDIQVNSCCIEFTTKDGGNYYVGL